MATEKQAHIYGLVDPRDARIHYVGKSVNPQERLEQHLDGQGTSLKDEWLDELSAGGSRPQLVILESGLNRQWDRAEDLWFGVARRKRWPLANQRAAGNGGGYGMAVGNVKRHLAGILDRLGVSREDRADILCIFDADLPGALKRRLITGIALTYRSIWQRTDGLDAVLFDDCPDGRQRVKL